MLKSMSKGDTVHLKDDTDPHVDMMRGTFPVPRNIVFDFTMERDPKASNDVKVPTLRIHKACMYQAVKWLPATVTLKVIEPIVLVEFYRHERERMVLAKYGKEFVLIPQAQFKEYDLG